MRRFYFRPTLVSLLLLTGGCASDSVGPDERPVAPEDAPRVGIDALRFAGAFRLPASTFGASSLNYSEGPIEVAGSSLFLVGHSHDQAIAEFTLPELGESESLSELPFAESPTQPFATVLDRAPSDPDGLNRIGGLEWVPGPDGPALLVSAYEYYDAPADNRRTTLIVRDPTDLAGSPVDGFLELEGGAHLSGWMTPLPEEWADLFGAPMLAGSSSGIPIIGRASVGPSAFAFDPAHLFAATDPAIPIPTRRLLDYDLSNPLHDDLDNGSGTNDLWTHLSRAVYGFVVPGTRTYLTVGHSGGHGPGGVCYKCVPVGREQPCGGYCARDPDDQGRYYWAFDLLDLLAASRGESAPESIRPYAYGTFQLPFAGSELGGGSYDAERGLLYLTLQRADLEQGIYANPPLVVAFEVR